MIKLILAVAGAVLIVNILNFMIETVKQLKRIAMALEAYASFQIIRGDSHDEQV